MYRVVKLSFAGKVVGYRAFSNSDKNESYDIDINTVRSINLDLSDVNKKLTLTDHNGLLLSRGEIETNIYAKDLSNEISSVRNVFDTLRTRERPLSTMSTKNKSGSNINKSVSTNDKQSKVAFNNGLALFIESIEQVNSEYSAERDDTTAVLVFSTQKAIKHAGAVLGARFDSKKALEDYKYGIKGFRVRLDAFLFYSLTSNFKVPLSVFRDGFMFEHQNIHDGTHFSVKLVPPDFRVPYDLSLENTTVGTSADGQSLASLLLWYKEAIARRTILFYPTISKSSITISSMW